MTISNEIETKLVSEPSQPVGVIETTACSEDCLFSILQKKKVKSDIIDHDNAVKNVSFCDQVVVWKRKDSTLSCDAIEAMWLQENEIEAIRKDMEKTLSMIRNGERIQEGEGRYSARGLHHLVHVKANIKARKLVVNAVLTEQDLQRYEGIRDDNRISTASQQFSADHCKIALFKGTYDQNGSLDDLPRIQTHELRLMQLKRKSAMTSQNFTSPLK